MGDEKPNDAAADDTGVAGLDEGAGEHRDVDLGAEDADRFDRFGVELATVLRSAHETAARTRVAAEEEAAAIVARADAEARERHEVVDAEVRGRRAAIESELDAERARVRSDLEDARALLIEAQEVDRAARRQVAELVAEAGAARDALGELSPLLLDLLERADATMSRWGDETAAARDAVGQMSVELRELLERRDAVPVVDAPVVDEEVVDLRDSVLPPPPPPPPGAPLPPNADQHTAVGEDESADDQPGEDEELDALSDAVRSAVSRAIERLRTGTQSAH